MMNVLTDILCDTSSMMAPQSYKDTFEQNEMSQHDISAEQGPLHLLDSVSHISSLDRPLPTVNHSSPSNINLFNHSSQIHIPSNIDPSFEERNNVSVFSDSFPEIVPSWLGHDFMKVSDNLPSPGILSNVSDIYSANRGNEHLEILDLGCLIGTTQDVPNALNRSCVGDSQKLLGELPMQRFSTSDSLIIPSFNDMNNTHLRISMNKNNIQYQKYKQNGSDVSSAPSLMNSVLPCENELLHLPLPSNLTEQCLNSSSSPSIVSNRQSQSHPVDAVCDKLPQINLNHLDSLLGNEAALSEIQLLRHNFPNVPISENGSNSHSNRTCLDSYNPNGSIMPCNMSNVLSSDLPTLPRYQDASIQVSVEIPIFINENCFSCSEVGIELPIETIQCFKCKFCDYINIHKCAVANHVNLSHSKTSVSTSIFENTLSNTRSDNFKSKSIGGQSETHFNTSTSLANPSCITSVVYSNMNQTGGVREKNSVPDAEKYLCVHCNLSFSYINDYNTHLITNHYAESNSAKVQQNLTQNKLASYQLPSANNIIIALSKGQTNQDKNILINNISNLSQNNFNKNGIRKILPKKLDDSPKKNYPKKSNSEATNGSNEKNISSHKKAWQRKLKRELGTYICEFKGCNVRFRALDNLEYHRKCHSVAESAFSCPECGTNFDNWGAIAGHLWRNHGNDMELHACDQCPFRTYSLTRLENLHKRIHKDECLYLCDTCGKSFKNGKQLRNHRARHVKPVEKPINFVKCNICSNYFRTNYVLQRHQSIVHNKLKPFVCKYCDYSASKKSTMDLHMRQHTGEKPFKCDECAYCSSDHNTLRKHKMIHNGEKPYKCPYCPYSCIQACSFKAHLKKHPDSGLMFSCHICSFKTIKQKVYISHMSEHGSHNRPMGENPAEIHSMEDMFPLAEAMDISLSQSDNNLLSNFNKNKNIQSFLNNLNMNLLSGCEESLN